VIKEGLKWKLADGNNINIWQQSWLLKGNAHITAEPKARTDVVKLSLLTVIL